MSSSNTHREITFTKVEGELYRVWASADAKNVITNIQIELGSVGTDIVDYVEPTDHISDADGNLNIEVLTPDATFIVDGNITVTARYIRDINKTFDSIVQAILSLGGNV